VFLRAMKFYWTAAKGYRLTPWKSPYIRWRMETFAGMEASPWGAATLLRLLWKYRRNMARFLSWLETEERRRLLRKRGSTALLL